MADLKQRILNLFLDNTSGDITSGDMRTFVNTIFDSKENKILKISTITEVSNHELKKDDIVIVFNDSENTGMYIAKKNNPAVEDLLYIAGDKGIDEIITQLTSGSAGQMLLTDSSGKLVWGDQPNGYIIKGTKNIYDILILSPIEENIIYIAKNNDGLATIPGVIGDGYSWNNGAWINIGPIRGTKGETGLPGARGLTGPQGIPGAGVTAGGTTGQVLSKIDNTDFNTEWVDAGAGTGTGNLKSDGTVPMDITYSPNISQDLSTKGYVDTVTVDGGIF